METQKIADAINNNDVTLTNTNIAEVVKALESLTAEEKKIVFTKKHILKINGPRIFVESECGWKLAESHKDELDRVVIDDRQPQFTMETDTPKVNMKKKPTGEFITSFAKEAGINETN
jgi:acyl-CoA hydrolase